MDDGWWPSRNSPTLSSRHCHLEIDLGGPHFPRFHFQSGRGPHSYGMPTNFGSMLDELTTTCDADGCAHALSEDERMLIYRTSEGERRAYECDCGAVTITVHR